MNGFPQVQAKAAAHAALIRLQQESVVSVVKTLEARALEVVMRGGVMLDPEMLDSATLRRSGVLARHHHRLLSSHRRRRLALRKNC